MNHKVKISVSDKPKAAGYISCRNVTIRDRLLRLLFGDKYRVTILVPGDCVEELAICEAKKGDDENGKREAHT